jgi:CRISPR/Cas system-associated exonuclease Cas4 (RecB family)
MNMSEVNPVVTAPGFSWSYSALKNFETCPRRYYAYNVAKDVKEPESEALKTGHEIHAAFDARVSKGVELPAGMTMHEGLLSKLADAPGSTMTEQKLGLASDFSPTKFFGKTAWFRIVLDYVNVQGESATVVDYKTGRPTEDLTQLQLSAVTVFAHHARVQRVKTALAFVAHDQIERATFDRSSISEVWGEVLPRVKKLVEARQSQQYPPKPGGLCRRWCAVTSCPFHGK